MRRDSRLELAGTNLLINSVEQEDGGEYDCEVDGQNNGIVSRDEQYVCRVLKIKSVLFYKQ